MHIGILRCPRWTQTEEIVLLTYDVDPHCKLRRLGHVGHQLTEAYGIASNGPAVPDRALETALRTVETKRLTLGGTWVHPERSHTVCAGRRPWALATVRKKHARRYGEQQYRA